MADSMMSSPAPSNSTSKMWMIGLAVLILMVIGFVAFSRLNDRSEETVSEETPVSDTVMTGDETVTEDDIPDSVQSEPIVAAGDVQEFTVRGSTFKFSLNEMRVKQGDTVRVTFVNDEGMHDWRVDEFNAATQVIAAGQQETIEFVADKTGQFEYYCSVGQHRQLGMKGMLIVE